MRMKGRRRWMVEGVKGGALLQTPHPSLTCTVSFVMSSRCVAEDGGWRVWVKAWRGGGCLVCHVLRRGETPSKGTLSALMEWLATA